MREVIQGVVIAVALASPALVITVVLMRAAVAMRRVRRGLAEAGVRDRRRALREIRVQRKHAAMN